MSERSQIIDLIRTAPPEVIGAVADRCDGHTIFAPAAFTSLGLPPEVVLFVTEEHRSDGSPKGTIFTDGEPVQTLRGVYGLDLLQLIAWALGVEYRECLGRGSQARAIQQALRQYLASAPRQTTP